jgi:hypothetical protein
MANCSIDYVYLQKMKLHEIIKLEDGTQIRRVPEGWIYTQFHYDPRVENSSQFQVTSVFVSR